MRKKQSQEEKLLDEIISDLSEEINAKKDSALRKIGKLTGQENYSFQQFNGRFGGKNNTYVDSVRTQFLDFEDFYAQWIKGMIDQYESDRDHQLNTYGRTYEEKASFVNLKLFKELEVQSLVRVFLERNFYKKLNERTRAKPDENLWAIWFGYKLIYGLIIAPVRRGGIWTNDKSEIRKAPYNYWTVGHVLTEGLVDPNLEEPFKFNTLNDLYIFYSSVLKRISSSAYEQEFSDKYIEYLKNSSDPNNEPFLIPEVRYGGLTHHHEHRLDFTILNSHAMEYTGIEISPASSHMSVRNLKEKQVKVNEELKKKWEKEMKKRNDYFSDFGITTITFTDLNLQNIEDCLHLMKHKLSARPELKIRLSDQIYRLNKI